MASRQYKNPRRQTAAGFIFWIYPARLTITQKRSLQHEATGPKMNPRQYQQIHTKACENPLWQEQPAQSRQITCLTVPAP
jgi:hypothetical protein